MEKYVAEALPGRAAWAPLLAASDFDAAQVIGDGHSDNTPGLGDIAGLVANLVKKEVAKTQSKRKPGDERSNNINLTAAETGGSMASSSSAAPRCVISTRIGVGHVVRIGDPQLAPELWETACGWKFGGKPHAVSDATGVNCKRCKALVGLSHGLQVGS